MKQPVRRISIRPLSMTDGQSALSTLWAGAWDRDLALYIFGSENGLYRARLVDEGAGELRLGFSAVERADRSLR